MLRGLLIVGIFAAGATLGNLLPAYADAYRLRLQARLDQVSADLTPFREIAERRHGGSLAALIRHHLASDDPTFHDEGTAIAMMLNNHTELAESVAALDHGLAEQVVYLIRHADSAASRQVREDFRPGIAVTPAALQSSLAGGFILLLASWMAWTALRLGVSALRQYPR